jgi:hypothetical protein
MLRRLNALRFVAAYFLALSLVTYPRTALAQFCETDCYLDWFACKNFCTVENHFAGYIYIFGCGPCEYWHCHLIFNDPYCDIICSEDDRVTNCVIYARGDLEATTALG